ncbi:MAG: hypothetical protein KZQ64_02030 [gamma proteobacterium symbiont of Bathyaustriella thionipta]|nr:hypothetical protein [gamma proteobacterium symbiont of Bathyaustriella thionipta]MCU7950233.1 hypothetical protein [gamma proteobacterium symbiont of Bathyaustriella thionipta]MCU7952169.1 hypothetical protein [gamma proteobacterium symbiont of Bathyaustriella thionipta]MCU7956768.1 hypothetical protein [gamma proteobacterium symbiont of Bathyaustriella thionipta]MCU7968898.1 hypothetical protein [gamma proteobacterium symbiont of Bathyaustriella thionipta]
MDMLDFEGAELYFDEVLSDEVQACIDQAAENYAEEGSEQALMRAYFLEPEHPMVLVAMYRYFYYQHRIQDALIVANRVLRIYAKKLDFPDDWKQISEEHLQAHKKSSMTLVRFYLLALKGAAYLELRLGEEESAVSRLKKILELDSKDRLGAKVLLNVSVYKGLKSVS